MKKDYYQILGVTRKAKEREIRKAYLKLARRQHPDVNPGDRQAPRHYREIREAYRVLSDRKMRETYDRTGRVDGEIEKGSAAGEGRAHSPDSRGWENIVREIFHDEPGGEPAAGRNRGEDLHLIEEVTFQEALKGARKRIQYQREQTCRGCAGKGFAPGAEMRPCDECGSSGLVRIQRGPYTVGKICPHCGGNGEIGSPPCGICGGKGRQLKTESKILVVKAGSDSGSRVVIRGGGQSGRGGGANGDLVVTLKVLPHPHLERRGYNLFSSVRVTVSEAALGATILVPTAEKKVSLKIPPGSQCGQKFLLRGKGVPTAEGAKRGDLYVTIEVVIPEARDPRARRLFRDLEKIFPDNPRVEA